MIDSNAFETLIVTNTIIAVFCIILLVALTIFIILFLLPSIRRQWVERKPKVEEKTLDTSSPTPPQQSFTNATYGASRFNPLFERTTGVTSVPQFSALFHPHAAAATLLHPAIWASIPSATTLANPLTTQRSSLSSRTSKHTSATSFLQDNPSMVMGAPPPNLPPRPR